MNFFKEDHERNLSIIAIIHLKLINFVIQWHKIEIHRTTFFLILVFCLKMNFEKWQPTHNMSQSLPLAAKSR